MTDGSRRSPWVNWVILTLAGALFVSMVLLGNWQVRRLSWKLDLIEQVETRAYGDPVLMPIDPAPEYQRARARGEFLHQHSLKIKAVTDLGPGYWVMTPLQSDHGLIWVNRGFVPTGLPATDWTRPEGIQTVVGLIRHSQPGGTLLERNSPETGRWVSADLAAMFAATGLPTGADHYLDADHFGPPEAWPRGGMTRLTFKNSHLSYALTWYAMAALFFAAMVFVVRDLRRSDPT